MSDLFDVLIYSVALRNRTDLAKARRWCRRMYGEPRPSFFGPNEEGVWRTFETGGSREARQGEFYFKEENHAIEFKLRWG